MAHRRTSARRNLLAEDALRPLPLFLSLPERRSGWIKTGDFSPDRQTDGRTTLIFDFHTLGIERGGCASFSFLLSSPFVRVGDQRPAFALSGGLLPPPLLLSSLFSLLLLLFFLLFSSLSSPPFFHASFPGICSTSEALAGVFGVGIWEKCCLFYSYSFGFCSLYLYIYTSTKDDDDDNDDDDDDDG
jgi:hypothetical protein